jgi:hypothetical protein
VGWRQNDLGSVGELQALGVLDQLLTFGAIYVMEIFEMSGYR